MKKKLELSHPLVRHIEEVRTELATKIKECDGDLSDQEVVRISQRFDFLLNEYHKLKFEQHGTSLQLYKEKTDLFNKTIV